MSRCRGGGTCPCNESHDFKLRPRTFWRRRCIGHGKAAPPPSHSMGRQRIQRIALSCIRPADGLWPLLSAFICGSANGVWPSLSVQFSLHGFALVRAGRSSGTHRYSKLHRPAHAMPSYATATPPRSTRARSAPVHPQMWENAPPGAHPSS